MKPGRVASQRMSCGRMPEQSTFATATRPERMVAVENETARISGTMPSDEDEDEDEDGEVVRVTACMKGEAKPRSKSLASPQLLGIIDG